MKRARCHTRGAVTEADDQYWQRARYRSFDHPVAHAFAVPKIEHVSRFVELRPANVLDVGCGNGLFTSLLAERAADVVAVDSSEFMLGANPVARRLRARAEQLPFPAASFDVVFAANLLHHVAEPLPVVREFARLTRRFVVLIEPNRLNPVMALFGLLVREERGLLRSSSRHLKSLISESGLRLVRCTAMGMISQNNTPAFLLPLLRSFDTEFAFGEYLVAIAENAA